MKAIYSMSQKSAAVSMQKQVGSGLLVLAIGLVFGLSGCKGKKEVTLKFADCPVAVQKTISDNAGGVQFPEVEKETRKNGQEIYGAKGKKANGGEIKIKVGADGHLIGFKSEDKD